jgi:hypothetical protein
MSKSSKRSTRSNQRKFKTGQRNVNTSIPVTSDENLQYHELPSPFRGFSQEQIIEIVKSLGTANEEAFRKSFLELKVQVLKVDPILLISAFSFYYLAYQGNKNYTDSSSMPVSQHNVELLQALILQQTRNNFQFQPALPQIRLEVANLTSQVALSYYLRQFNKLDKSRPMDELLHQRLLEFIRVNTQMLRNWGYPQQIYRVVKTLFAPLDDRIEKQFGVRISSLVEMGFKVVELLETRMNNHRQLLLPIIKAGNLKTMVEAYKKSFPHVEKVETLLTLFEQKNMDFMSAKIALVSHTDLFLPAIYEFSLTDFLAVYPSPIEPDKLRRVLEIWSLSFGELALKDSEDFFMANPVWEKPLIRLEQDKYFWPIPGLFLSFCTELMENIIKDNSKLLESYHKRRGTFLEEEIERLLGVAFPLAKIYRGSQWIDPGSSIQYENDFLVMLESFALVIEAKAGRFTAPAKRGAEKRVQHTIEELLIAPSEQSFRFVEYLKNNPGVHRFDTKNGTINEVDNSTTDHYIRLNVTLEHLSAMGSRWPELMEAGFVTGDHNLGSSSTMSLGDMESVFDVLTLSSEKLHYLSRRTEIEEGLEYFADELDLLAFYLDTGFNLGENALSKQTLVLRGASELLDPYFMQQWTLEKVAKPICKRSKWWQDILKYLQDRQPSKWLAMSYHLLNVAYQDQIQFERKFRDIQSNVKRRKDWQKADYRKAVIGASGVPGNYTAFAGLAYKQVPLERRNELIHNVAGQARQQFQADAVVVIGIDVAQLHYPYNVLCYVVDDKNK